jgi:coenzyme F420 hydrogenase subunit delta
METDWYGKSIVILGCGNWLCGDDGFGSSVAQRLERGVALPADVCVLDVGTSIREILFDITLSDKRPAKIIVVDAVDCGREPGELFALDIESLPKTKLTEFSPHQMPTCNLLRELRDLCDVEVTVIACQVQDRSDQVRPGLSRPVKEAVQRAVETLVLEHIA